MIEDTAARRSYVPKVVRHTGAGEGSDFGWDRESCPGAACSGHSKRRSDRRAGVEKQGRWCWETHWLMDQDGYWSAEGHGNLDRRAEN